MLFFILSFILAWLFWLIFADKKRWRELFPVGILAGFLGSTTDVVTEYYPFWDYHCPNGMHSLVIDLVDDWGIFLVVTYLFIQWLPKNQTFWRMFRYWFIWTGFTITVEWIYVSTQHMEHSHGWTYLHSYLADWFLLWVFYKFHKRFRLSLLGVGLDRLGIMGIDFEKKNP